MRVLTYDQIKLTGIGRLETTMDKAVLRHWVYLWLWMCLITMAGTLASFAQAIPQPPKPLNIAIENVDVSIEPRKVIFSFSVTYDGFVEVSVFKKTGDTQKRIWKTQTSTQAYRKTSVVLNYKPPKDTPGYGKTLPSGTYYYEVYYKGVTRKGTFSV